MLAKAAGLWLVPEVGSGSGLDGDRLHFDTRASAAESEAFVAGCVAQCVLRWAGDEASPTALRTVTLALLDCARERGAEALGAA